MVTLGTSFCRKKATPFGESSQIFDSLVLAVDKVRPVVYRMTIAIDFTISRADNGQITPRDFVDNQLTVAHTQ